MAGNLPSVGPISPVLGAQSYSRTVTAADTSFASASITLPATYRPYHVTISATVAAILRVTFPDGRTKDIVVNSQYPVSADLSAAFPNPTTTLNISTEVLAVGTIVLSVGYA